MPTIGHSVPRHDGHDKVTGAARYIDDLRFPGMLYGRTIRSSIPCGRIRSVRCDFDPSGFTIVDYRDIPGRNVVALIADDQPCLAEREVRHAAEPIVLLAHESREALLRARVDIDYEPGNPVFDPCRSTTVFKAIGIDKGDVETGFREAEVVVEGEYRVGHQEHVYIEPNGVIAVPDGGGVTLYGSLQCPYYVQRALHSVLGLPTARVRVVQAETGGGFGGKEEYPSIIAAHACLLALKAGRPVKLVYDRAEDMQATTKRHPGIVLVRTGVTREGRLVALDIDVLFDGGAYTTLSPVVLSRGVIHATGPYRCPHVRVRGRVVMTNTPPNGAFRGFGAPQTQFAAEVHMERVADTLGIDPVRLREINALRPGDTTATGQVLGDDTSALAVLREAVRRTDFRRRRRALRGTQRGLGLALFFHGAGFTGAGEVHLASKASLELTERGARVLAASAEIGQGARTVHAQIVADTLGLPYEAIEVARADTAVVPDSGPTVASRTSMVVGRLLERCAREMKEHLAGLSPREYLRRHGPLVVTKQYRGAGGSGVRRTHLPGRCLRNLRLGLRRRRGGARPGHLRGPTGAVDGGPGDWAGAPPDTARRAGRGWQRAGHRLRPARGRRHARRPDGQWPAHQLPGADHHGCAPDRRGDPRTALPARAVWRQGHGRAPLRRGRAGPGERRPAPRLRRAGAAHDPGAPHGNHAHRGWGDGWSRSQRGSRPPARPGEVRGSGWLHPARRLSVRFLLNGKMVTVRAHPMARLLDVLREDCGLTGTKEGCGEGECGACTVLLDGQAVNACLVPFGQVRGRTVVTIEGLEGRHPLQAAFIEKGGTQCGICTPGMIMAAAALPGTATLAEIRRGLAGNICRCTGYSAIYRAVLSAQRAARVRRAGRTARRTGARGRRPGPSRSAR